MRSTRRSPDDGVEGQARRPRSRLEANARKLLKFPAVLRRTGVGLVVAAYALLLYASLASPAYGRAHSQLGPALLAEYTAPWPVALGCTVAMLGIVLAIIPIRRGERWAMWASAASLGILLTSRLATDPRCLVVLDPHQHGCHTFIIAVVAGVTGLGLVARSPRD